MKLKHFKIQNYSSIVDSGVIDVADITVLMGANESGKSSILRGLATISMDSHYQDFDLTQLNRVLKRYYDLELKPEDIKIVWAKFELSEEDENELKSILKRDEAISTFEITKYFNETYEIVVNENEPICIPSRYLYQKTQKEIGESLDKLQGEAKEHLKKPPNNNLTQQFNEAITEVKKITSTNVVSKTEAKRHLQNLKRFPELGADQQFGEVIQRHFDGISELIDQMFPSSKLEVSLFEYLLSSMPRTVYFKIYERLEDDVSLDELKARPQDHRTFHNFLTLAEIKIDTIERLGEEKSRQVYIESGCGKASQLLRYAWHQEVLDIALRFSNGRFMVFTKNSKAIETLLPPSLGSEGFQWFLGFYINFGAATNAEYKRAILLLDDAGVFLHPKGHKDLMDLFEEYLKRDVTTIYSTHLPFLIPKKKLKRIRLVEKEPGGRTKVTEKFYAVKDKDILYPLRAAIGVTLADSLFVWPKTIVAEGLTDRILLNGMLEEYGRRKIKDIDRDNIGILAGRGASGVKNHALMLQIENLPYVAVLDNDGEGRSMKEDLAKEGIIPEENVVLLPAVIESQKDFDIEDMLPLEIYVEAFYNVHGRFLKLTSEEILAQLKEGRGKISNKAIRLLKKSKIKYDLDKVNIAYEILGIIHQREKLDRAVIGNFNKLFDELHKVVGLYKK